MKSFKIFQFSIYFSTTFLIFSLASGGGSAPEPPTNPYFQNFLTFSLNFRENFDNIFQNFQKIAKCTCKFSKNYKIFIAFLAFLKIFEFEKMRNFWFLQWKSTPPKLPGTPPNAKSCINYCYIRISLDWLRMRKTLCSKSRFNAR